MDTVLSHLKPQEIPYDHRDSCNMFEQEHFVATPAALDEHFDIIPSCLSCLRKLAQEKTGLDYLQVFSVEGKEDLWFMDDGYNVVTALLPSDY